MTAFDPQTFRSALRGDGARPNLFEIQLTFPSIATIGNGTTASQKLSVFARATQMPGSTIGVIPIGFFGREVPVPGNVTYAQWTFTVINDEDFMLRSSFEKWLNALNSHKGNLRDPGAYSSDQYSVDGYVIQYGKRGPAFGGVGQGLRAGGALKKYKMVGAWPSDVSAIEVAWDQNNTIEEFSVTMSLQWWESVGDGATT